MLREYTATAVEKTYTIGNHLVDSLPGAPDTRSFAIGIRHDDMLVKLVCWVKICGGVEAIRRQLLIVVVVWQWC
jgi:hypothetical protein